MSFRIRYTRYLFALDIFGTLSLALVLFYLFAPSDYQIKDSRQDSMIANILSELVGIWVSVRLIEFFTRRNEARDRVRVRAVRNMRMIERLVRNVVLFKNGIEVQNLRREVEWTNSIRAKRAKHFSLDELDDLNSFHNLVGEFCALVLNFGTIINREPIEFIDQQRVTALLGDLQVAREKAEDNIFEETDEDDGM